MPSSLPSWSSRRSLPSLRGVLAVTAAAAGVTVALLVGPLAAPAQAACHIAGFFATPYEVAEPAGTIDVVVVLQGRQPGCAGTVDYVTVDGSAVAGEDYTAARGTLAFEEGDDREETVTLTILADDAPEGAEEFFVELSNPTAGITGTSGPATVTILADAQGETPAEGSDTTDDADAGDTDDGGDAADAADDGGGSGLLVLVAVLAVAAVGAVFVVRARGGGS